MMANGTTLATVGKRCAVEYTRTALPAGAAKAWLGRAVSLFPLVSANLCGLRELLKAEFNVFSPLIQPFLEFNSYRSPEVCRNAVCFFIF
jgi:hypothetical protein